MESKILLCSDLDRTILPNGHQPESKHARFFLANVARRSQVQLAYVSGRNEVLLRQAIGEYKIPVPNFAIGDVGTTIYEVVKGEWRPWIEWSEEIAPDWNGAGWGDLARLFHDLDILRLQDEAQQSTFKLSYYVRSTVDPKALIADMQERLTHSGLRANLIWSVDEAKDIGLLDVLPASANKLHAIRFLMERKGIPDERAVFAGDSGNDLPVLVSGMQSILVKNAHPDVREEALRVLVEKDQRHRLYIASGAFFGMNGNYSAGVIEGLAHFFPEVNQWLETT